MQMTGSQIIVETLVELSVDTVFGYPGGAVLYIYDELYKNADRIRHIITCHEQGAAHAADGYARSTGKTGVVIATSGPGATNLVTGIATAYLDSVPMVAITGNVTSALLGKDSFQEVDITGITMPITKHNFIVRNLDELAPTIREAFQIANSDRPGPVLIDIPKDLTLLKTEFRKGSKAEPAVKKAPDEESLQKAVDLIKNSKRPLIFAGGGVISSGCSEELLQFSKQIDAPVTTSLMAMSVVPSDYPLNIGMIGMHGTVVSAKALLETDLLIAIGVRFSDRVIGNASAFAKDADIIHIDLDNAEIGKNIERVLSVHADAGEAIRLLSAALEQKDNREWTQKLIVLKTNSGEKPETKQEFPTPSLILPKLKDYLGDDGIVVTDVGQHQMWAAQFCSFTKPRTFISSCGLGTMGFGMGAAIGAKIANPNAPVVLITGDGSFHMNMNEIATAVTFGLPLVVLIMNNGVLGMVRQWQKLFYDERYSYTTLDRKTDYVKFAEALGAVGYRIEKADEIDSTLQQAFSCGKPCIIDCRISRDIGAYPMIPPGGSAEDVIYN